MLIHFQIRRLGVFLAINYYAPEWDVVETRLTLWGFGWKKTFGKPASQIGDRRWAL